MLISSFIFSCVYWFFPVAPSRVAFESGIYTVGFFHRFLKLVFKEEFLVNSALFVLFFLGVPIVFYFLKDLYLKWKHNDFDFRFFLNLTILAFLIIMPFSYLAWEKYFLPLIPLVSIRILLTRAQINET